MENEKKIKRNGRKKMRGCVEEEEEMEKREIKIGSTGVRVLGCREKKMEKNRGRGEGGRE